VLKAGISVFIPKGIRVNRFESWNFGVYSQMNSLSPTNRNYFLKLAVVPNSP
jgi:hypothetical protein